MVSILVPLLVLVVGLVVYALATNPKAAEAGRILFFCGAFFATSALAREIVRLP